MAAPMNRLWTVAARGAYRIRPRPSLPRPPLAYRRFHPSRRRYNDDPKPPTPPAAPTSTSQPEADAAPSAQTPAPEATEDARATPDAPPKAQPNESAPQTAQESDNGVANEASSSEDGTSVEASGADKDAAEDNLVDEVKNEDDEESFTRRIEAILSDEGDQRADGVSIESIFEDIEKAQAEMPTDDGTPAATPDDGPKTPEEIESFLETLSAEQKEPLDEWGADVDGEMAEAVRDFEAEFRDLPEEPQRREKLGLMALGDEDEPDEFDDEIFEGDDMPSLGHGDLERHREMRSYARIIAWDMPLLAKFAKPFEPPTADTPLRFRFTSYLGETHPAEPKVVVEFCTADLPMEPAQRLKLVKLLGARYDPQRDLARMSCEKFPIAAQNKRYLLDQVNTLVREAKCQSDAEGGKDAFDDVPVDFRHVKWRPKLEFPEEWKMTPERRELLRKQWEAREAEDFKRTQERSLIDGKQIVEKRRQRMVEGVVASNASLPNSRQREYARVR